jgi:hypothetical protein
MNQSKAEIQASLGPAGSQFTVTLTLRAPAEWVGRTVSLRLGEGELLRAEAPEAAMQVTIDILAFRTASHYALRLQDGTGAEIPWTECELRGEFFEALLISPQTFWDRAQLNHSRFQSRHLLELAAHGFYLRHPEAEFPLRGAALTILGHRYLEKPPDSLTPAESARVAWLLDEAERVTREGAALIHEIESKGAKIDWRHVRWTVSLATVAAHLALYEEDYEQALSFLELATRHTHLVNYSKVSALNFVICAFAEGVIAHLLGRTDRARSVLIHGIESVKPIVQAQNLLENVWVLGDLQNVLRAARQCYIVLVRMGILEVRVSPPVIEDAIQIDVNELQSPLPRIIRAGRVPELAALIAAHGGR